MSTALNKYQRLEASALWREAPDAQRREVIVSIGDESLIISDLQDRPLAHWSLGAVERANPGKLPAIFFPDGHDGETLELPENEIEMLGAIDTLRKALRRQNPHPGRLRWAILLSSLAILGAGLVLWLPKALQNHVTGLVPALNRIVIGQDIITHLQRTTGAACQSPRAQEALTILARELGVADITVVPEGIKTTASVPGPALILGRAIVEDHDDPSAAIGFMLAETLRAETTDPLSKILTFGGLGASFGLLTTGQIPTETLGDYAAHLTIAPPDAPSQDALAQRFSDFGLHASPYAHALDISGESTLALIEADAIIQPRDAVLSDAQWVALQEICAK